MHNQIAIALGACACLAGAAFAQTQSTPTPGAAATPGDVNPKLTDPTTSSPAQVTSAPRASTTGHPAAATASETAAPRSEEDMSAGKERLADAARAAKAGEIVAGSPVQDTAGRSLGTVRDIVPSPSNGAPEFVLVSTRSGKSAIPYAVAAPFARGGHLVLDGARLDASPRVSDSELLDKSDTDWKRQSQEYWAKP